MEFVANHRRLKITCATGSKEKMSRWYAKFLGANVTEFKMWEVPLPWMIINAYEPDDMTAFSMNHHYAVIAEGVTDGTCFSTRRAPGT